MDKLRTAVEGTYNLLTKAQKAFKHSLVLAALEVVERSALRAVHGGRSHPV